MRTSDEVLGSLERSYVLNKGEWYRGNFNEISIPLKTPTERDVMEDRSRVRTWSESWHRYSGSGKIEWKSFQWSMLGKETLPKSIVFDDLQGLIKEIGRLHHWSQFSSREKKLTSQWPQLKNSSWLYRRFDDFSAMLETDFARLMNLLIWIEENPKSNCYLRELPVPGIHTKWIEARKTFVINLMKEIGLIDPFLNPSLEEALGLKKIPSLIRIRLLDQTMKKQYNGLDDISVPIDAAAKMPIKPRLIIIIENQTTGVAIPDMEGVVAILSMGYAVSLIESIPWVHDCPHVLYWGDIDTHGMSILNTARRACPTVRSFLMNHSVWSSHAHHHVAEEKLSGEGTVELLTSSELHVMQHMRDQQAKGVKNTRLEQEKISWQQALKELDSYFNSFCR